jgi:8-oxo-(d)GTP phosphatase
VTPAEGPIVAAGAAVLRRRSGRTEVLMVHAAKYGEWTLPKGKLDPGETPGEAAVREVEEETGVRIGLGPPLPCQTYGFLDRSGDARTKVVHYWVGRAVGSDDVSAYSTNAEITEVRWVPVDRAPDRLTHARDAAVLRAALAHERPTSALVVVRHALALDRTTWKRDDRKRPLSSVGEAQAQRLVPTLRSYAVGRLVSSTSRRATSTLAPYAEAARVPLETTDRLTEEDATRQGVAAVVADALAADVPVALSTHRKMLPHVWEALGLAQDRLDKGAALVLHHVEGRVAAVERIPAT